MPWRMNESTTIVRTNEVTVITIAGSSESTLKTAMILSEVVMPSGPNSCSFMARAPHSGSARTSAELQPLPPSPPSAVLQRAQPRHLALELGGGSLGRAGLGGLGRLAQLFLPALALAAQRGRGNGAPGGRGLAGRVGGAAGGAPEHCAGVAGVDVGRDTAGHDVAGQRSERAGGVGAQR